MALFLPLIDSTILCKLLMVSWLFWKVLGNLITNHDTKCSYDAQCLSLRHTPWFLNWFLGCAEHNFLWSLGGPNLMISNNVCQIRHNYAVAPLSVALARCPWPTWTTPTKIRGTSSPGRGRSRDWKRQCHSEASLVPAARRSRKRLALRMKNSEVISRFS